ncbi:hypothetical protein BDW62DRAFT_185857 [Aspergillus aurantiobrunneus]
MINTRLSIRLQNAFTVQPASHSTKVNDPQAKEKTRQDKKQQDRENRKPKMGHHHFSSSPSSNATIHITVLTIATLLILSLLILVIGPSRILSDSYSSSSCPQQQIHITPAHPPESPANILNTAQYDGTHLRIYNSSQKLLVTTIDPSNPHTWESLLSPPLAAGGLRIQAESINHLDDYPDVAAEPVEGGVGHVIAMMHQLHCLIAIRGLIFPENNNVLVNSSSKPFQESTDEGNRRHWSHCFEYLAQVFPSPPKLLFRSRRLWIEKEVFLVDRL